MAYSGRNGGHMVVKLLLANLWLCLAYDFGYHPSAEEYDSLWHRDRHRLEQRFVPRYQHAETSIRFEPPELNFQLFSQEQEQQEDNPHQQQQQQQPYVFEESVEQEANPSSVQPEPDLMHVQSQLLEIKQPRPQPSPANGSSQSSFPIFFSNPATGIVYAISQVGEGSQSRNDSSNNGGNGGGDGSIAIYVTKAQYDADLQALRQRYEKQCQQLAMPQGTVLSTPNLKPNAQGQQGQGGVTARPQIIRLQKPKKSQAGASNKLPKPQHRPPPVMVTSGPITTINDQVFKLHHKASTSTSTTRRPKISNIKRKKRKKKKPAPVKTIKRRPGHKRRGNSTTAATGHAGPPLIILGKRPAGSSISSSSTTTTTSPPPGSTQLEKPHMPLATTSTVGNIFSQHSFGLNQGFQEHYARPQLHVGPEAAAGPGVLHLPHAVHLLHRNHSGAANESHSLPDQSKIKIKKKKKSKAKTKPKAKTEKGSGFDIFELMSGGDYDDDDADGEEEEDAYYYEDEDAGHEKEPPTSSSSPEDPKEDSSSAEEGADFGAMEESESGVETTFAPSSTDVKEEQLSSTKNSMAKKKKRIRIRRRPPASASSSEEEDYDDDDSGGIGGFFRMIFYPVQVAMSRLMDFGFGSPSSSSTDEEDEEDHKVQPTHYPKFPSYTLYHSAHSNEAYAQSEDEEDDDEEEEEDGSSGLGSWFSSWFGPGRRTKKIGSTTTSTTTVLPVPAPTQEPASWLESWFGLGKTTTTTTPTDADEDDYDKWFYSWFDAKPKRKVRRRSTTSTTTSTTTSQPSAQAAAQVPILTIVDPLRNPQNWIGILAHHIVNSTGTTTANPLLQALVTRMTTTKGTTTTTTTTEKPDLPRRISYDKYQIWRLKPQDEAQVRALEEFKKGEDGVKMHWLKGPSLRGLTDVLVPQKMLVDFQGTLNYEGIAHEVLIFDVGKAIAYEQSKEDYLHTTPIATKRPSKPRPMAIAQPGMTWNRYHTHDEIVQYLETMRMRHPQLVELIHIGRSYEGRPLIVVKIESKQSAANAAANATSSGYKRPKRKRKSGQANAVFVEAGAHGLAWIGPATATWMISELLRLMKTNSEYLAYFLPFHF
ncbi:uncharacterized protein DMAD_00478 [Drosophila madeirensis]|uniref:Peptidase M14 domain-containing protein n=1 Tax=Drosophila madeirensis TaxID=30013 RepID=A0AAU9FYM1_DROMD